MFLYIPYCRAQLVWVRLAPTAGAPVQDLGPLPLTPNKRVHRPSDQWLTLTGAKGYGFTVVGLRHADVIVTPQLTLLTRPSANGGRSGRRDCAIFKTSLFVGINQYNPHQNDRKSSCGPPKAKALRYDPCFVTKNFFFFLVTSLIGTSYAPQNMNIKLYACIMIIK